MYRGAPRLLCSRMTATTALPALPVLRLRAAPSFVQAQALDGRPFVAKDSEPYTQFWLSERERVLLAQFAGRHGARGDAAYAAYLRVTGKADSAAERQRAAKAVREMQAAGVLLAPADDSSRYSARIAADYMRHRPFPRAIAQHIINAGAVRAGSRVLDLAGGPGDLALALAQASQHVSLMELSRGFLQTAAARAHEQGLNLETVHDSANRLVHHEAAYDVVTVSQALHWLDDVAVCRGLCRLLLPDGSFFVVHGAMEVPDSHPLAHLLGWDSILGAHPRRPFADEVRPLLQRLALLFDALDAPEVQRTDPTHSRHTTGGENQRIAPSGVTLYRQPRPLGPGFARGFFTPAHIAVTGLTPAAFWHDLEARCAAVPAAACLGVQHWAVLHFQRGASGGVPASLRDLPVQDIAFDGPTAP
jgi:SAM-dependent methyltransferase